MLAHMHIRLSDPKRGRERSVGCGVGEGVGGEPRSRGSPRRMAPCLHYLMFSPNPLNCPEIVLTFQGNTLIWSPQKHGVRPRRSPSGPWAEGDANRPHRPLARPAHSQRVHPGQPPEGPVRQPADVVPLQLQHLQAVQPLERQALDQPDPIPIEVPEETRPVGSERLACTPHLQPSPHSPCWVSRQQGNPGGGPGGAGLQGAHQAAPHRPAPAKEQRGGESA